jgi:predicted transcriptional regulator
MGKERRDYAELCREALKSLDGPKTVNEVAEELEAGWVTAERCLDFLESIGILEVIKSGRMKIYRKKYLEPIPGEFIKDLTLIINRKGTRHRSISACLDDALRDFIHKEMRIKRY